MPDVAEQEPGIVFTGTSDHYGHRGWTGFAEILQPGG